MPSKVLVDSAKAEKLREYRAFVSAKQYDYTLLVRYDLCDRRWESCVFEMHLKTKRRYIETASGLEDGKKKAEQKVRELWEKRKRKSAFKIVGWNSYFVEV